MRCVTRWITALLITMTCHSIVAGQMFPNGQEIVSHLYDNGVLGSAKIRAIAQDHQGFLWIGSEHGLFRYDGYDFKEFRHDSTDKNSIAEDKIYTLFTASDGRLWIGTKSTLSVYDPKTRTFKAFRHNIDKPHSLINNEVYRLYEDKRGGIWVSTFGGLSHLPYGQAQFQSYTATGPKESRLSHSIVYDVIEDKYGKFLVATDAGIDILDPDTKTVSQLHYNDDNIKTITAYNFFKDSHGKIWIGSFKRGLMWLGEDHRTIIRGHPSHAQFPALPRSVIRTIIQANEDEIWASVYGMGIAVIDRASGQFLRALTNQHGIDTSLANNTVQTMFKDSSGLIWLGYLAGNQALSVVNSNARASRIIYTHSNDNRKLDIKEATVISQLQNGNYLLAGEGLNLIGESGKRTALPENLRSIDKELKASSNNNQAKIKKIKDHDSGVIVFVYQDRRIKTYNINSETLDEIKVDSFCKSMGASAIIGNNVWLACNALSLMRVNITTGVNTKFNIKSPGNIKYSYTNKIIIDQTDTLWISSEHGLFTLDQASTASNSTSVHATHLLNKDVTNIHIDKNNDFWADTSEGLYRGKAIGKAIEFSTISNVEDAPQGSFFRNVLIEDDSNRLWGSKGVFDVKNKQFYPLDKTDGYNLIQSTMAMQSSKHELLFSTPNGIMSIIPSNFAPVKHQAKLSISGIRLDNQEVLLEKNQTILMQDGKSTLYVEISILDFTAPSQNQYRYNLQSDVSQWQDIPVGQRSILFSNLAPGTYTLYIRGKNSKNIYSNTPQRIDIKVLPQWYQSALFKTLIAFFFILLFLGFYRLRTRQHIRKQGELKSLVSERTQELNHRNQDLELRSKQLGDALDELMDTQEQLLEKEKMAALGELVSGVAHEVNTPLGIGVTAASHLNDSSRLLQRNFEEGSLTQDTLNQYLSTTIKTTDIILSNLNRSSKLIKNFKNISVDQTNDTLTPIELKNYFSQVLNTLSPAIKGSNCTVNLHCESTIEVVSHPGLIAQLITNLVNNSIQHGCEPNNGGTISIDIKKHSESSIRIIHSDDGVGIPEDIKRKIYEPFFTTKRGKGGSGLGLSIVFNLVTQRLGGQIHCASSAPEGAKFEILLPMNLDQPITKPNSNAPLTEAAALSDRELL